MKKSKRNIYLHEFEAMSYRQRFYYLWKNELRVSFPKINTNPLKWCLMDALRLCYVPVLYLLFVPVLYLLFVPLLALLCANEARHLKTRYADDEDKNCTYIEGWVKEANK